MLTATAMIFVWSVWWRWQCIFSGTVATDRAFNANKLNWNAWTLIGRNHIKILR